MTRLRRFRMLARAFAVWRRSALERGSTTEGWQDKSPHGAGGAVGWFCWGFGSFPHVAGLARTVSELLIALNSLGNPHVAGQRNGR